MSALRCGQPELLEAYAAGTLSETEVRVVERHVAACAGCRALLAGMEATTHRLRVDVAAACDARLAASAPADMDALAEAVAARLARLDARRGPMEEPAPTAGASDAAASGLPLPAAAGAAAVWLLVLGGALWGDGAPVRWLTIWWLAGGWVAGAALGLSLLKGREFHVG